MSLTRRLTFPAWGTPRQKVVAWWPIVLPLALLMASDYKIRSRPPEQTLGGGVDATILLEIGAYGLVALFLYGRFGLRPPVRRTSGLMLAAWAWAGFLSFSALWSVYPKLAIVRAVQVLIVMSTCQVLATRASAADLRRFAHAFIVLVMVSVGIGVAHPFPRTSLTQDRFNWLYVHPVQAGVYLGVAVLLVLSFLIRRDSPGRLWPPIVYVGCLAVLSGALVATGTRGAAMGTAVGLVVLLASSRGPRGRADLLVMGLAVAAIVVLAFSDKILEFATRGETESKLLSLNSRTDLWALAFDKFAEQPIFGYGLGATRGIFLREIGLGGGHNAFINALVDNGAVGAAIFTGLLITLAVVLLRLVRRQDRRTDAGLLLGLVAFFVTDGLTMEGLATPANVAGTWLFILIAWAEALRRRADTDTANPGMGLTGALVKATVGASPAEPGAADAAPVRSAEPVPGPVSAAVGASAAQVEHAAGQADGGQSRQ